MMLLAGRSLCATLRLLASLLVAASLCSCFLFRDSALEGDLQYVESRLPRAELDRRLAHADELYRQPRTPNRVAESLAICLESISAANGHAALWRAARATAWLAQHLEEKVDREQNALLGLEIGREAIARVPAAAATYYFYALNIGILSDLQGRGLKRVSLMEKLTRKVIEFDARLEHAGGHRFLGLLYLETMNYPLVAVGDLDDALEQLRRACELAPDYGHNHLALARALIEDDDLEEAREQLRLVLESPVPPDRTEEHAVWLERARQQLGEIGE